MPAPLLPRAPIDEIVVGFILDQPLGPDPVQAGRYMAERKDVFVAHELHEPIVPQGVWIDTPNPRVWLINQDETWMVQMQQDRFYANWRRRNDAAYPGFSREGGAMHFALREFRSFQMFCEQTRGKKPNAVSIELSKIDVLIQNKHWNDVADAAQLVPVLGVAATIMVQPGPNIVVQCQERAGDATVAISLTPARMRQNPQLAAFRLEFKAAQPAAEDLETQLLAINAVLNSAFARVIPEYEKRFS
jgi:hypothetical protein